MTWIEKHVKNFILHDRLDILCGGCHYKDRRELLEETMKIALKDIRPNPYRNLTLYPLLTPTLDQLVASIEKSGFWDNVVVRKTKDGYELAYGHHRLEAAKRTGLKEADFIVKTLSDDDMLTMMYLENQNDTDRKPFLSLMESVEGIMKGLTEGTVHVELTEKVRDDLKRVAPSFISQGTFDSYPYKIKELLGKKGCSHKQWEDTPTTAYTVNSIGLRLNETTKRGEANLPVKDVVDALELMELGRLERTTVEACTTWQHLRDACTAGWANLAVEENKAKQREKDEKAEAEAAEKRKRDEEKANERRQKMEQKAAEDKAKSEEKRAELQKQQDEAAEEIRIKQEEKRAADDKAAKEKAQKDIEDAKRQRAEAQERKEELERQEKEREKEQKQRRKEFEADYAEKKQRREDAERRKQEEKDEKEKERREREKQERLNDRTGLVKIQRAVRLLQEAYGMDGANLLLLIQKDMGVEFEKAQRIAAKGVNKFSAARARGERS
jgi:chemotaxis protein histidine kinase CheA